MNVLLSLNLRKLNPEANFGLLYATPTVIVALDLLLKLVGSPYFCDHFPSRNGAVNLIGQPSIDFLSKISMKQHGNL